MDRQVYNVELLFQIKSTFYILKARLITNQHHSMISIHKILYKHSKYGNITCTAAVLGRRMKSNYLSWLPTRGCQPSPVNFVKLRRCTAMFVLLCCSLLCKCMLFLHAKVLWKSFVSAVRRNVDPLCKIVMSIIGIVCILKLLSMQRKLICMDKQKQLKIYTDLVPSTTYLPEQLQ